MTLLASVLRMVADHFPQLIYGHPHTYLVAEVYARGVPELALVPPPDKPWLDEIPRCPVWTLGGAVVLPEVGAEVMVMFRDADKRYPVVVAFAAGVPQALDLGESEGTGELVARETDPVHDGAITIGPDSLGTPNTFVLGFWPYGAVAPTSTITLTLAGMVVAPGGVPGVPTAALTMNGVIATPGQSTVYA